MRQRPAQLPWGPIAFAFLLLYPLPFLGNVVPFLFNPAVGAQLTNLFIFGILALGLNVVVGNAGLLHLGIGAFFGIGAYLAAIVTIPSYPFQWGFTAALIIATLGAAFISVLLAAPTLRLRGDYLALVTLGFGEVARYTLQNLDAITGGNEGLNPIPPPKFDMGMVNWKGNYVGYYYLALVLMIGIWWMLRNLERSRIGRSWVALREDELAANCMGLNPARLKLAAFALASGIAGFAGCLYAFKLGNTSTPSTYDFNRSIFPLCCLILGGLGNRNGVLVGVLLIFGFEFIIAPAVDNYLQSVVQSSKDYMRLSQWKLMLFGLVLILTMRFRPAGLLPSSRMKHELEPTPTPEAKS